MAVSLGKKTAGRYKMLDQIYVAINGQHTKHTSQVTKSE